MVLQEEDASPADFPAVTIKSARPWSKHFYFIRPKTRPRFIFRAPAMALDPKLLDYKVEDKSRQATRLTIKFSKNKCKLTASTSPIRVLSSVI